MRIIQKFSKILKVPRNQQGQMLIEVVGAVVVAAVILTSAAVALTGNWQAIVRMSQIVPDTVRMESAIRQTYIQGCGTSQQPLMNCHRTGEVDILSILIKSPSFEKKTLPMLVYAPGQ